jgi:hypothetical protein
MVTQKWASSQVPLTIFTSSRVNFEWHSFHQQAFDDIKKVIGTEAQVILCYPDFNKPFHLDTDASDHQLESVIMQDKNPIAFYSRKINTAQKQYRIIEREQELFSANESCKEFKIILLGYQLPIIVFTCHENKTFNRLRTWDRVFRWLLLLEEYGVTFDFLS